MLTRVVSGSNQKTKMAVDVVLTSYIQNTIVKAIKYDHIPQDLAERLSKYAEVSLEKQEPTRVDRKVPIPFILVKQLWECLREKQDSGKPGKRTIPLRLEVIFSRTVQSRYL